MPVTTLPLVSVYVDESCLGNGREGDNPGGAAGLIEARAADGQIVRRDFWIAEPSTTNNRMALRSGIETFRALSAKGRPARVVFTSDSRYLIDGLRDWVFGWAARGWVRKSGPIENLALWHELVSVIHAGHHEAQWRWVRGHDGHPQNEYANHLATRAAAAQTNSAGLIPSEFEPWLATRVAKGHREPPEPFPDPAQFHADRPVPAAPPSAASLPLSPATRR
ncbi:MAG TPA: ribonuclease H [Gemmatimonadaceae bacterium]|nr:ribonuclease H [Gemmatimonadaceae bacterium]